MIFWTLMGCSNLIDKVLDGNLEDSGGLNDSGFQENHDGLDSAQYEDTGMSASPCQEWLRLPEGGFLPQRGAVLDQVLSCSESWHASAGAKDSMVAVSLELWDGKGFPEIQVENLLGEPLIRWRQVEVEEPVYLSLQQSGEFLIVLRSQDPSDDQMNYRLTVDCITGCDLEYTRYPIFFMHGLAGFDSLLNVMDYWKGVEELLVPRGYHVEIDGVPAFDTTYVRSNQWADILNALYDAGVGRKFNLIGHSQGGLDARYFASILDDKAMVASITTVSTPHDGSAVADALTGAIQLSPLDGQVIDAVIDMGAELFGSDGDTLSNQLEQMTRENMVDFNAVVPDLDTVQYFSWAGKSCRYLQWDCQNQMSGETVSSYFLAAHALMEAQEGDNDGLVSTTSAQWGTFLGILPADHMDEVGHRFDLSSQPFRAAEFYLSEAQRLASAGL